MPLFFLILLVVMPLEIAAEQVVVACEQNSLEMSCDKAVIIIQRAIYGREDNKTCRPADDKRSERYDPSRCQTLIDMTAVVRYHCQFQQVCHFDVSQIPFDFDCVDLVAYLRVSYNCLPLIGDLPRTTPAALTTPLSTTPKTSTTSTTTTTATTIRTTTEEWRTGSTNTIGNIAEAIITEALAEAAPISSGDQAVFPDLEKTGTTTTTPVPTPPLYPIMGTNDLLSGWGACPECELCVQRSGRIKCFFVLHNLTWPDAKQGCLDMGGELATVRSDIETRFLNRTKFILGIHNTNAWIGLRWKQSASAWLWVDDVVIDWELSYTVFAPGEPDNWNGWEACVEFIATDGYQNMLSSYTGYWNDADCQAKRDAICQKHWVLA